MSEQALKTAPSGTGTPTTAATGTFQVVPGGNADAETGSSLPPPAAEKADPARLAEALNAASRRIGRDLRFQVDLELGYAVIQVLDRETGEIIRQIPPENAKTYVSELGDVALRLYDARV